MDFDVEQLSQAVQMGEAWKTERFRLPAMVEKLAELGYPINTEEDLEEACRIYGALQEREVKQASTNSVFRQAREALSGVKTASADPRALTANEDIALQKFASSCAMDPEVYQQMAGLALARGALATLPEE